VKASWSVAAAHHEFLVPRCGADKSVELINLMEQAVSRYDLAPRQLAAVVAWFVATYGARYYYPGTAETEKQEE